MKPCVSVFSKVPRTHTGTRDQDRVKRVINKNNPKVAVEETGGREIQVDIKSGECQQQTPDVIYIHV